MVDSYLVWSVLQKRQIAFTNYKDYIGMDITSLVTLPVWIMEPYTILQKVAEIMEYTDALDRAAATEDPYERSVCITRSSWAFAHLLWAYSTSICNMKAGVPDFGMCHH